MTIEAGISEIPQAPIMLYPLGGDPVVAVVRPLFEDSGKTWSEYLVLKAPILDAENPYANEYLMVISENFSGLENEGFIIGITLAYEILKEKAGKQKVPVLSSEFVQAYDEFVQNRLISVYGKSLGSLIPGADREEEVRRGLFAMLEKEAYKALDEEMTEHDDSIFDKTIFSGFVASYFLFREGFSDSSHWESD